MMMENLVKWRLIGETEVLGENLLQRYFVYHKSHLPDSGLNPGRRDGKPATNRLSYGAALLYQLSLYLNERSGPWSAEYWILSWYLYTLKFIGLWMRAVAIYIQNGRYGQTVFLCSV
jgi:hypothetical protein